MRDPASTFRGARALLAAVLGGLGIACVAPQQASVPAATADPVVQGLAALVASEASTAVVPWPVAQWWRAAGDPQLDRVVEQALAGNPDVAVARANASRVAALAGVTASQLAPAADASASLTRQRLSETGFVPPPFGGRWITNSTIGVRLAWNLDLSGAQRDRVAAARGQADAARLEAAQVRGAVAAAAARLYFELQAAMIDREVVAATLAQREAVLRITQGRVQAGLDGPAELRQSEALVPALRLELAQADERVALTRHQLAALAGREPGWARDIPKSAAPAAAGLGLPADLTTALLANRADVLAARLRIEAAAREVDASRRDWLPNLNLSALAALDSALLDSLFDGGSRTFAVGPALSLPLFDAGRRAGATAAQRAAFDAAEAQYRGAVVAAAREVADAVTRIRSSASQREAAAAALDAEREALRLTQLRYEKGLGTLLQVLVAQDRVLGLERRAAALEAAARSLQVDLQEALGAGVTPEIG